MPVSIELKDAARYFGKKIPDAIDRGAKAGLLSAAMRIKQDIITKHIPGAQPFPPVARGTYRAAWNVRPTSPSATTDEFEVYNDAPHAPMVEYGVRAGNVKPGRAMIAGLAEWASIKGIADGPQAVRVAFAIAKSMMQTGIFGGTGLRILEKAMADAPRYIREEVVREIERALRAP